MPSMPSGLPRSVMAWLSQVSVSVGTTLVATMIYAALPKVSVPPFSPLPELTSGGKFAARVLPAASLQAFDGLDTMPLPPPMTERPVATSGSVLRAGSEPGLPEADRALAPMAVALTVGAPAMGPVHATERSVKAARPAHVPFRAEARHPARSSIPPIPEPVLDALVDEPTVKAEEGWLPQAISAARTAWTVTASTSGALLAHVVPPIP